ncbi:MAG: hypothetical protein IJ642_04335 [Oscillospiraceae bacterium]|nr:hypothetical protein [Oscillospiraceae bacterium]
MNGYITFWSQEYVRDLRKAGDSGQFKVVYGSHHTRMPYISSLKIGDIIYPVAIENGTLCIMARLPIEKIEPAFDYLLRETGQDFGSLTPEGVLYQTVLNGKDYYFTSQDCGFADKIKLPDQIHTIIHEKNLTPLPHQFHQKPITCCAKQAASGSHGSLIQAREIPFEKIPELRFGKTPDSQKPLKLDKNGKLRSTSLAGFIRKLSDETFRYFETFFS